MKKVLSLWSWVNPNHLPNKNDRCDGLSCGSVEPTKAHQVRERWSYTWKVLTPTRCDPSHHWTSVLNPIKLSPSASLSAVNTTNVVTCWNVLLGWDTSPTLPGVNVADCCVFVVVGAVGAERAATLPQSDPEQLWLLSRFTTTSMTVWRNGT